MFHSNGHLAICQNGSREAKDEVCLVHVLNGVDLLSQIWNNGKVLRVSVRANVLFSLTAVYALPELGAGGLAAARILGAGIQGVCVLSLNTPRLITPVATDAGRPLVRWQRIALVRHHD